MIHLLKVCLIIPVIFVAITFAESREIFRMKEEIVISSRQYIMIESAVSEFRKLNFDIVKYKIRLIKSGVMYIVIFEDRNAPRNQRGASTNVPTFEVLLDAKGNISRSHFSR